MIGSVQDDDGVIHLMYIRNEVPYIYSMRSNLSNVWSLCQRGVAAKVLVGRIAPTCLGCAQLNLGYDWHPMVLE